MDSTSDLLSYYFATILHLGALFKLQHRVLNKITKKIMETINVVIDEASTFESLKDVDQLPKSILPLTLENDQEVDD